MTENLATRTYGTVTLSAHPSDPRHLCWRTLEGARVSPYFRTLEAAHAHGRYLSRR